MFFASHSSREGKWCPSAEFLHIAKNLWRYHHNQPHPSFLEYEQNNESLGSMYEEERDEEQDLSSVGYDPVELREETHPVVYPARNGHAR